MKLTKVLVLENGASYQALKALNELSLLLESHSDDAKLTALRNESDLYSLSHSGHTLHCEHTLSVPDPSTLVYRCCAVLSFLGMYWSPILHSVVSPGNHSLLPPHGFKTHQEANGTCNTDTLLKHIMTAFSLVNNETKEELFDRAQHCTILPHPMPGLGHPEYGYY